MNKLKFPKVKKVKKSTIKKKAWNMFSKYIRMSKDLGDGMIACYTCGNLDHWKRLQAGHGIEGRNNAVLFLEEVVKPQCIQCNIFRHGNLRVFTLKLIDELGRQKYEELLDASNSVLKYTTQEYQEIYERYKSKVERLGD